LAAAALLALLVPAVYADVPPLQLQMTVPVGGEGRWDYLTADVAARRLYVTRGSHTQVLDLDTGSLVGDVPGSNRAHGVAIVPDLKLGFVSSGGDNTVIAFDTETFKVKGTIKTGASPDAIVYDPASKHVLAMDHRGGDIAVIDPADLTKDPARITVGGTLEYAAVDGAGHCYVNVEDKSEIAAIDTKANTVLAHWSLAPGDGPTGLAIDPVHHHLFAGCGNKMMVVLDSDSGKCLGTPAIGAGCDGVAFDADSGLALAACGRDAVVSVIAETAPGRFDCVQSVKSVAGARTIAIDRAKHRALLPCLAPDANGGMTFSIAVIGPKQ
jgi:YVTN family beta-propeller protein